MLSDVWLVCCPEKLASVGNLHYSVKMRYKLKFSSAFFDSLISFPNVFRQLYPTFPLCFDAQQDNFQHLLPQSIGKRQQTH